MNNGSQETGQALGHCMDKEKIEKEKSEFYFDADDATAFKAAFAKIGKEIAKDNIRVKS